MKQNPLEDIQKIRLNEEEYKFCGKLAKKIERYNSSLEEDRQKVLAYLEKECKSKKYTVSYHKIDTEDEFIVYQFNLNNKPCYVSFEKNGKSSPNLIPSGVVQLGNPNSN